ncbi:MAG TPA: zf-HC2 domain-containing protein [Gemmatimonadaceae bacterium]
MPHLSADQLAGYIDHALEAAERATVESHLEICDACRADMLSAKRITQEHAPPRRSRLAFYGVVGTAAAAALILVVGRSGPPESPGTPQLREATAPPAAERGIAPLHPASGDTLAADSVVLAWRPLEPDAEYRLTLSTPDGTILWSSETGDTTVAVPDSVFREAGPVFWYVDALRSTGRAATTGVREFVIVR